MMDQLLALGACTPQIAPPTPPPPPTNQPSPPPHRPSQNPTPKGGLQPNGLLGGYENMP